MSGAARTARETIVIDTRLSGEVSSALVDDNQLENAILNLAINGRDALPSVGRLEISTGMADIDGAQASLSLDAQPGRSVRVEVRDFGEGMTEEG